MLYICNNCGEILYDKIPCPYCGDGDISENTFGGYDEENDDLIYFDDEEVENSDD